MADQVEIKNRKGQVLHFAKVATKNVTIEPMFICFMLPYYMANLTIQNLNLQKACRVNLNYSENLCDGLFESNSTHYNETIEVEVQHLVSSVNVWKSIVQSLFPVILLLFLGPWSDRNKCRKTCLLVPMIGEVFSCMGLILCTYFFYELPVEISAVAESIPMSFTGGLPSAVLGAMTFVQSISTVENRSVRTGVVALLTWAGVTSGFALSGILYRAFGFYGVFSISICFYCCGILYGLFILKENRSDRQPRKHGIMKDLFLTKNLTETFNIAFRAGNSRRRVKIWLNIVIQLLSIGPIYGSMAVTYMYGRYKFHWNELDYSLYTTVSCVIHLIGNAFVLGIISKWLQWNDGLIGAISCVFKLLSCFVYAFAPTTLWFYVGILVDLFIVTSNVSSRSIVSKLVENDELGKANSLLGIAEAVAPLLFTPLYSALYNITIDIFAGTFFFVGAGAAFITTIIYIILYVQDVEEIKNQEENQ